MIGPGGLRTSGTRASETPAHRTMDRGSIIETWRLVVDLDAGSDRRPAVEPLSEVHRQVDAAVTHDRAEIVVPVGAVQGMTVIGEILDPRHIRHVVVLAAEHALHRLALELDEDVVGAGRCVEARATGADICLGNRDITLPGNQVLCRQVYLDPALAIALLLLLRRDEQLLRICRKVALGDRIGADLVLLGKDVAERHEPDALVLLPGQLTALEDLIGGALGVFFLCQRRRQPSTTLFPYTPLAALILL